MTKISNNCVIDKNEEKCAPGTKYDVDNKTCFSIEQLITIANMFNKKYTNQKITITHNKKQLLKSLVKNIEEKYNCGDESCWLNTDIIKNSTNNNIKNNTLKPIGPYNNKNWLSTFDINKVLKQYESKYNNFKFLGTVPYDFEDLPILGIGNINFDDLINNGIYKLGMVINLDNHNQNGSHWVGLYTDMKKKHIYFFDSVGKKPKKKIKNFIKKIYKSINTDIFNNKYGNYKPIYKYNKIQHQIKNSECGVYSINFIIRSLAGEKFENITNNIIRDDEMQTCREAYFRG